MVSSLSNRTCTHSRLSSRPRPEQRFTPMPGPCSLVCHGLLSCTSSVGTQRHWFPACGVAWFTCRFSNLFCLFRETVGSVITIFGFFANHFLIIAMRTPITGTPCALCLSITNEAPALAGYGELYDGLMPFHSMSIIVSLLLVQLALDIIWRIERSPLLRSFVSLGEIFLRYIKNICILIHLLSH